MTANLFLTWLEKQILKMFRLSPDHFPVCNPNLLRVEPAKELARIDLVMPLSFLDLITWAKYRNFDQVVDKDSVYGFPENLIDLARFLDKG